MEKVFVGVVAGASDHAGVTDIARATIDFISLAQYTQHTDESLAAMSSTLAEFHKAKSVFVQNGIRQHFNIPKVHSMAHYTESIKSRGTADGYNTESPERLHIDFAKKAYRATNKRDYEAQMVKWLGRQEAVQMLTEYMVWVEPMLLEDGRVVGKELAGDVESEGEGTDAADEVQGPEEPTPSPMPAVLAQVPDQPSAISYRIAKQPPACLRYLPTDKIETHFGAKSFIPYLSMFLHDWRRNRLSFRCRPPSANDLFGLYTQLTLCIVPSQSFIAPFSDRIRCTPGRLPGVFPTLGESPFFSTVLIRGSSLTVGLDCA